MLESENPDALVLRLQIQLKAPYTKSCPPHLCVFTIYVSNLAPDRFTNLALFQ